MAFCLALGTVYEGCLADAAHTAPFRHKGRPGKSLLVVSRFEDTTKPLKEGVVPPQPYQLKKFLFVLIIYVLICSTSASAGGRL